MKKWIATNKLYWIGAIVGGIAGYIYWKYVGCLTGTCAITSNPIRSTIYFGVTGALVFGLFKSRAKEKTLTKSDEITT